MKIEKIREELYCGAERIETEENFGMDEKWWGNGGNRDGTGKIYTGDCTDRACALGISAERNVIFNLITCGENKIKQVIAVNRDGKAMPLCGACRESMS